MATTQLFENLEAYTDHRGREFRFVELMDKRHLLSWQITKEGVENQAYLRKLDVSQVPVKELESISIWDQLSKKIQEEVEKAGESLKNVVHERMEKARKSRRKKYEGIPREYECITCGEKQTLQPGNVAKRIEKKDLTIEQFIAGYQCQRCNPTKGRRGKGPNPKYAGLPEELVCQCGATIKANYSYLDKKAEKTGKTLKELAESYQCQKCNPTIGRKKGTKNKKKRKKSKK